MLIGGVPARRASTFLHGLAVASVALLGGCPQDPSATGDPASGQPDTVVAGEFLSDTTLQIWGSGGDDSPAASAAIVSPSILDFRTSSNELSLVVRSYADGEVSYRVESDSSWVQVLRPTGRIIGGWTWLTVALNRSAMSTGNSSATLRVWVNDEGPAIVGVKAKNSADDDPSGPPPPGPTPDGRELEVSPTELNFGATGVEQSFLVRNAGTGDLTYTIASDVAWAEPEVHNGTSNGDYKRVVVTANRSGLGAGAHTGFIRVEADNGQWADIALQMFVPSAGDPLPPEPVVNPGLLEFGETATSLTFELRNAGEGGFSYTASASALWLSAAPPSGQVESSPRTITVNIDRAQLPPGQHLAWISVVTDVGLNHQVFALVEQPEPDAVDGDDPAQILAWLRELDPLQKTHYSWPVPGSRIIHETDPLIHEYVRLTGAVSMRLEDVTQHWIRRCVSISKAVTDETPTIHPKIGLNYSPWYHVFPRDAAPTYVGPEHAGEIALFREKLVMARDWLAAENAAQGAHVEIGAVLIDSERFHYKADTESGAAEWNAALADKLTAIYRTSKEIFPNAWVEWNSRGAVSPCAQAVGWCNSPYTSLLEEGDGCAIGFYNVVEIGYTREKYVRTLERAQAHGYNVVTPWIALAAGYRRDVNTYFTFLMDWDYDVFYSWQIGAEVNHPWFASQPERFAPYDHATHVMFYPEPFGRTPHWGKHFVAYVRGAHIIQELP